jgi:hypothetical protein
MLKTSFMEQVQKPHWSSLALQDGAAYFKTFLAVLKNVTKEETTEYVLALIDEALQGENTP